MQTITLTIKKLICKTIIDKQILRKYILADETGPQKYNTNALTLSRIRQEQMRLLRKIAPG